MVIWFTGLSGAGKSTVARTLQNILATRRPQLALLDDDAGPGPGPGRDGRPLSESGWMGHVRSLQSLARSLAERDIWVLVTALYAHPHLLRWNRIHIPDYFEVLIDAPLHLVRARDPRGIYAGFMAGEIANVVGLDIPYHRPADPDLVLDAASGESPEQAALRTIAAVPLLSRLLQRVPA